MPRLGSEPCPRCGCWLVNQFTCNCGEVHSDHCVNCGRWTFPHLARDEYTELDETDVACTAGTVLHEHDPAEKAARKLDAFFAARALRRSH